MIALKVNVSKFTSLRELQLNCRSWKSTEYVGSLKSLLCNVSSRWLERLVLRYLRAVELDSLYSIIPALDHLQDVDEILARPEFDRLNFVQIHCSVTVPCHCDQMKFWKDHRAKSKPFANFSSPHFRPHPSTFRSTDPDVPGNSPEADALCQTIWGTMTKLSTRGVLEVELSMDVFSNAEFDIGKLAKAAMIPMENTLIKDSPNVSLTL